MLIMVNIRLIVLNLQEIIITQTKEVGMNTKLRDFLKKIKKEEGKTLYQIANELGVSYNELRLIMRGEINPKAPLIAKIEEWSNFQITAKDLIANNINKVSNRQYIPIDEIETRIISEE